MSAFVDPFEGSLADLETTPFKTKIRKFLDAFNRKDGAAVGEMRKDPQLEWVFNFTHYYDAATATPQRTTVMNDIAGKYPSIPKAYSTGVLKAMLTPVAPAVSSDVARVQKYGIATREDAFALAKGKGRSRRRRLTRRRRTTRKRS
jgi:hypothetical protein